MNAVRQLILLACVPVAMGAFRPAPVRAQHIDSALTAELHWRMIGPFRGGRTVGATGVPGQPNVFYIGVNNGGVWKSTDYGRVWRPIFDDQPTGSIGAIAVAPSDPNTVYVGSGEGLQRPDLSTGDGIYKSTDAGTTWTHLGLRDGQQIGAIIVDPHDTNRLFVAVLGHPYGPNPERGVYRSTDGGRTFQKVLYKDENTGAIDLAFDPSSPRTIYAVLWAARQGPWEYDNAYSGSGSGVFKSTDGGDTWRQLATGLPTPAQGLSRIGIGIAPSDPSRIYAEVNAGRLGGLFRSDDAGEQWTRVNSETRVSGRGDDFAEVKVDPAHPDIVYVANTSMYRSTDGGHHFTAIKGAPGGDDYHRIWINPDNPKIMLLGVDQGATLTVNGGQTWSSWYNQPTAQMFHVATDNRFPYRIYGGQQESGSVGILSRGNDGAITFRDWHPVGVEEYGYAAPDPLHPGIIYGGKVSRYDEATGQVQQVGPDALRSSAYRYDRTAPILFSQADPHVLYFAAQVLFKTANGGHSWQVISPDLTRANPGVPKSLGVYTDDAGKTEHRGVIFSIGPSPRDVNVIWVGTDDGLIQVTRDGGAHWTNVTPPAMTPWSKVTQLDASHFDTATVYASVSRLRVDDLHPYIYRTHDGGKTWTPITTGLPDDEPVNVVREDPVRRGLLFAGTENAVYVSLDDGDHWRPLRLDMPATSIRDLVIHGNDVVVGTHGRSIWILDDITPLRQLSSRVTSSDAFLFRPEVAYRLRRDTYTDTPLPPEEPAGENPPDGAIIDYYLKSAPQEPVTLEVLDHAGAVVRSYSSADTPAPTDPASINVPMYWVRPPRALSNASGLHRFVWDLYYTPQALRPGGYPISAIPHDTPREPQGLMAAPGQYTVRLTVNGKRYTQPLTIKLDPRVKTPAAGLAQEYALAARVYAAMQQDDEALTGLRALRAQLDTLHGRAGTGAGTLASAISAVDTKAAALIGGGGGRGGRGGASGGASRSTPTLTQLNSQLGGLLDLVQNADATPTRQAAAAADATIRALAKPLAQWTALKTRDVGALNAKLRQASLPEVVLGGARGR